MLISAPSPVQLFDVEEQKQRMQVNEWLFIAIFFIVAWIFPALPIVMAWLLRPKRSNRLKVETYECGIETVGDAWVQFKVQYYLYALIFLVFDIEMIFLFPFAVALNQLPLFAVVQVTIFLILLVESLTYAWRKGALEWG
jgi:NADH-quinone oxidoreductase subunit A